MFQLLILQLFANVYYVGLIETYHTLCNGMLYGHFYWCLCKEFDKGNTEYLHLEMLLHLEMSIVWRIGEKTGRYAISFRKWFIQRNCPLRLTYNFTKKYRKPNSKQNCQIILKIDFRRVIISNKITTHKKSLIR